MSTLHSFTASELDRSQVERIRWEIVLCFDVLGYVRVRCKPSVLLTFFRTLMDTIDESKRRIDC